MVLDISLLLILAFFMAQGFRKGFFYSFVRALGWILAIIISFVLHTPFTNFVDNNTGLYDRIYIDVVQEISSRVNIPDVPEALGGVTSYADDLIATTATSISTAVFNVLTFIMLFVFIKLILFLLTLLFSRKNNDGFISGLDGFFGLLVGGASGIMLIFVLMTFLKPVALLMSPDTYLTVNEWLDNSYIAGFFYDINPILNLVDGMMPDLPDFDSLQDSTPDDVQLPDGVDPNDIPDDLPSDWQKDLDNLV